MKIKICGLTRKEDIEAVNKYLPDYIGFVFAESKRQVTCGQAAELKSLLDPRIASVGVFVNASLEFIKKCSVNIDLIQLHGDEDDGFIEAVKKETGLRVIKAVRIKEGITVPDYKSDFLLFDAYSPEARGGTGKSFDYEIIRHIKRPYFLAGGINAGNIEEISKSISPYCIDLSSGAETNGVKDPRKIKEAINLVRKEGYKNE